jgi:CO/xanthine dehydrogenase FAD-binding subunit
MVKRKRGSGVEPSFEKPVVFISHLEELKNITFENNFNIGAACTCSEIANNNLVPEYIKQSVLCMASPE